MNLKDIGDNDYQEDNNYLYKYLRCGMLHELLPKKTSN